MNKYVLLLITVLLLTGCTAKTEKFMKTCTIKHKANDITDIEKRDVIFNNKDELVKVNITRTYESKEDDGLVTIKSIKESAENYNNDLAKSKNIKVEILTNTNTKYQTKYHIDVQNLTSDELDEFDLNKNSVKYFNKLKSKDIECK